MKLINAYKIVCIYLLLTALLSVFYLAMVIFRHELIGVNAWFSIVFSAILIGVTIFNNSLILYKRKLDNDIVQKMMVNGVIGGIQVLAISTDGFYYQYVQGSRLMLALTYEHLTSKLGWGGFFDLMALEFHVRFDTSDHTTIGVNLIMLSVMVFSLWMANVFKEP